MTGGEEIAGRPVIPLAECMPRGVYRITSRNLEIGVFDGEFGFIGLRQKFESFYLFTEYHRDMEGPMSTVRPTERIGTLPNGILANEYTSRDPLVSNKALFDYLVTFESPEVQAEIELESRYDWDKDDGSYLPPKTEEKN